jgi:DNA-binding MarR family transcriptional regulator
MAADHLERVVEEMARIHPILHRKLHRDLFKVVLEEVGADIAHHHMMIIRTIQGSGPLSSSEIGEMLAIAKSQMTHSVDRLIELGMVEREHCTEDRRKVRISLTDKGLLVLERVDKNINIRLKEKLAILSDNELKKLAECFRYIGESFSKLQ